MESQNIDILLRIENTLGKYGAVLDSVKADTKETKKEVKYTNGKVIGLRKDVDSMQEEMTSMYQTIDKHITAQPHTKGSLFLKITWEKWLFILGSIATVAAYIIDKIL